MFRFDAEDGKTASFLIVAEHGRDRLASASSYYTGPAYGDPSASEQTVFFTDRSLYRPGQTIHYKGICIRVEQERDNYQTLAGQSVTVVFRDVNGQEIARRQHTSNDYGSFSGSFIAPQDRLMGRMSLVVKGARTAVRPSIRRGVQAAEVPGAARSARPGAPSQCRGDRPRQGDRVYRRLGRRGAGHWRVVRQVRYPIWLWWARWYPPSAAQAIAHGTAITASDGSFTVKFTRQAGPVRAGTR
jgi:hypothetical protein